jgi:hypothetical protein
MKLTLAEAARETLSRVIVESVDLSLYLAHADLGDRTALLVDRTGKALRTRNLLAMKALLAPLQPVPLVLRQRSAYDEMCGQSWAPADNTLEVPLGPGAQPLPPWEH